MIAIEWIESIISTDQHIDAISVTDTPLQIQYSEQTVSRNSRKIRSFSADSKYAADHISLIRLPHLTPLVRTLHLAAAAIGR